MNDRFNFRGQTENGKWIYGSLLWYAGDPQIWDKNGNNFIVKSETVGQCTGLKDKDGNLIFEGDVAINEGTACVIKWDNDKCAFFVETVSEYFAFEEDITIEDFEIIGNIYQNPELLEEKN